LDTPPWMQSIVSRTSCCGLLAAALKEPTAQR
jgi:hypothetical protein